MLSTMGAPERLVTPCSSISSKMRFGSTFLRQTWVAAAAVTAHVRVQPEQWNMGSVHRYRARWLISKDCMLDRLVMYAPRWLYMTPLGSPVVPDV